MRLTTKGRYAVTAMLDIALQREGTAVTLADIAARRHISLSYLEQLFARLRRAGLVRSVRGPGGGYVLERDPRAISVAAIIDSVDEMIDATRCGGSGDCAEGGTCLTHDLWVDLTARIHDFLAGISLAALVERHHRAAHAPRPAARRDGVLAELLVVGP